MTPVSEHGEPPLVSVPCHGRLSAVTVHGPPATPGVSSAAPTPTSRRLRRCRGSTRTELSPLVASSGDITVATDTSTCWIRDGGLCGMPREWIAELAGESAIVPTYRNRAAPFGGQTAQVAPATQLRQLQIHGPGNGTEVSPSLSEDSGRSRTPTCSGVCSVTEDGSMTMFDSGGNLLILELACGVDSVIQNASREFGSSYIGIHAGLELLSTQRQAYKFLKSFAEGSSGSADSQKLIQVHISLPCTGGSPLLDLSKKDRKPAQDAYFRLLDHCKRSVSYIKGMSNVCSAVTLELPKLNRFWSDERLKKFLTDHDMQKFADCAACAMGLETSQGQPIGKVFRIACSDQVLATGLERRFQCKCTQDHAPLNQVNYSMTERYSYKFARFYCRAIALRWIDQQEETS